MTVFELRSSKSDPAKKSPKTIVDLIDALDHQVLFAKGIADAIRGTELSAILAAWMVPPRSSPSILKNYLELPPTSTLYGMAHYKRRNFQ
jgi:hypothetical protein